MYLQCFTRRLPSFLRKENFFPEKSGRKSFPKNIYGGVVPAAQRQEKNDYCESYTILPNGLKYQMISQRNAEKQNFSSELSCNCFSFSRFFRCYTKFFSSLQSPYTIPFFVRSKKSRAFFFNKDVMMMVREEEETTGVVCRYADPKSLDKKCVELILT